MASSIRITKTTKQRLEAMRDQICKATKNELCRRRVREASMDYLLYFTTSCIVATARPDDVDAYASGFFGGTIAEKE